MDRIDTTLDALKATETDERADAPARSTAFKAFLDALRCAANAAKGSGLREALQVSAMVAPTNTAEVRALERLRNKCYGQLDVLDVRKSSAEVIATALTHGTLDEALVRNVLKLHKRYDGSMPIIVKRLAEKIRGATLEQRLVGAVAAYTTRETLAGAVASVEKLAPQVRGHTPSADTMLIVAAANARYYRGLDHLDALKRLVEIIAPRANAKTLEAVSERLDKCIAMLWPDSRQMHTARAAMAMLDAHREPRTHQRETLTGDTQAMGTASA